MPKSNRRPVAVINLKAVRKIADFILKVRTIVLNIGNHALIFVTPDPALAGVTTRVNELDTAEVVAETRVTGSAAARDVKYNVSLKDVRGLLGYVQKIADEGADEATSIATILAGGFEVKVQGVRIKGPLEARTGVLTGTVKLVAEAGPTRCAHEWQMSPNGMVWTNLTATLQASTEVAGLVKLSTQYFRHRIILKGGPEAWSPVASIIVL